jgi:hypothetical protein
MSVSNLTPPPKAPHSCGKESDEYRFNDILDNPLFTDEDLQSNNISSTDLHVNSGGTQLGRTPSMPVSFAPLMTAGIQCAHETAQADSPLFQQEARKAETAMGQSSVSVQTSPIDNSSLTDASDTSPESIAGAAMNQAKMSL